METGTMTGLMHIFRRHSAVLTKFQRNDLKSRPYWPRGGFEEPTALPGSHRRPGPAGVGRVKGGRARGHCSNPHPLQPLLGLPGPAPLGLPPFCVLGPWCWTPVLPTWLPHPVYPPWYTHPVHTTVSAGHAQYVGHCPYTRF